MAKKTTKASQNKSTSNKSSNSTKPQTPQPEPAFKYFLKLPPELRILIYTEHILNFHGDIHIGLPATRALMKQYKVQWKRKIKHPLALLHTSILLRKEYLPIIRTHAKINIVANDLAEFEREFIRPQSTMSRSPMDMLFPTSANTQVQLHVEFPLFDNMIDMLLFLKFLCRYPEKTMLISSRLLNCSASQPDLGRRFPRPHKVYRRLRALPLCVTNAARKLLEDPIWRDMLRRGDLSEVFGWPHQRILQPGVSDIQAWSMDIHGKIEGDWVSHNVWLRQIGIASAT